MDSAFFKFPRTPHLIWLSDKPARDDRVLSESEAATFIQAELCVEEKIDGANIGISVRDGVLAVQNRGAFLEQPSAPQFRPLWGWLSQRQIILLEILGSDRILFGEWCFAVHSARYDRLPDWFLGFDIYDRSTERFWSSIRRNKLLESAGISVVPEMGRGRFTLEDLRRMLLSSQSSLGTWPVEGLYLRGESAEWLEHRAKIVHPDFVQNIGEHWSRRPLERNLITR